MKCDEPIPDSVIRSGPYARESKVTSVVDPDSMGSLDPYQDPDSQSGSVSRRAKMTHNSTNIEKS
jgi:hypothetical protein